MPINVGTVIARIGGDTSELSAALQRSSGMLDAWGRGVATNLGRRLRAYTERFVAVTLVLGVIRYARQAAKEIEDIRLQAHKIGIDPAGLLAMRAFAASLGKSNEFADQLTSALKKAAPEATTLADAARTLAAELGRLPSIVDRQIEATKRLGMVLKDEELDRLMRLGGLGAGGAPSFKEAVGLLWQILSRGPKQLAQSRSWTGLALGALAMVPAYSPWVEQFMLEWENLQGKANVDSMILKLARKRLQKEEQRAKLAELADRLAKAEIDMLEASGRHRAALDLMLERRAKIEAEIEQLLLSGKTVEAEEKRIEATRLEAEIAIARNRIEEQMRRLAQERLAREKELNRELARAYREQAEAERELLSRRRQLWPTLEMIMATRDARGRPTPQAWQAREVLWLEKLVPWLRARGLFVDADRAEQRWASLRQRLAEAGFIAPERSLEELNRRVAETRDRIAELLQAAKQEGIKVKPELAE